MKKHNLYSNLAKICCQFYDLSVDFKSVANFVESKISEFKPKKLLFVGGFFLVAKELSKKGFDLTVVDYTDEMVEEGKARLGDIPIVKADLRFLPFEKEFDALIVIGRVFTHMFSDSDCVQAFQSIKNALKPGGILLFDNYEDSKILKTKYFNKSITVKNLDFKITRKSATKLLSKKPFMVLWNATYIVKTNGKTKKFEDEMRHRAFSRNEIQTLLLKNGFKFKGDGDNFDKTSFYSLAQKDSI